MKYLANRKRLTWALAALLLAGLAYGGWYWKQWRDDLVGPALTVINYTDHDVYASVHYSEFPNPGDGASDGIPPHGGGSSLSCCVPIPTHWRPGIKMIVWYSFKDWQKESGQTRIVELPEYPGGDAGRLYLVFHNETEFEIFSTVYGPRHPKWPGRRVEPVIEGVE